MRLKILTVPNPLLLKKSKPIKSFNAKLQKFITNLEDTLVKKKNPSGVGLSAPQVGKLIRAFATLLPVDDISDRKDLSGKKPFLKTFLNPQITKASKTLTLGPNSKKPILEGCLSIPSVFGSVPRHEWVDLSYTIQNTKYNILQKTDRFSGFSARVIQHELDHLDGILFTQRAIQNNLPLFEEISGKLEPIKLN